MRQLRLAVPLVVLLAQAPARAATITVRPGPGTPFQDALNAAQDGDTIVLRAGVYRETVTRSDIANLTISAERGAVLDGGSKPGDGEGDGDAMTFVRVAGLRITGLTVRNASDDGIDPTDCSNVHVSKCAFINCGDSGIEDTLSQGIIVEGCRFDRCDWGLAISYRDFDGSSGIVIRKNRFTRIGENAIEFAGFDAVIENNRITGAEGNGILADRVNDFTGATISGNRIAVLGARGIDLGGGSHVVTKNRIVRANQVGIRLQDFGGNTLEKNIVKATTEVGIALECTGNTLTLNKVSGSRRFDLQSTVRRDQNTFEGNKFGTTDFQEP